MKAFKMILKVLGITLLTALAVVILALSVLHIAKYYIYVDYYTYRNAVSPLPGIHSGFVPQGLGYDADGKLYLHSGYNGDAVEIHLVNEKNETKRLFPVYAGKDTPAKGHGGGIAVAGDYVYLADNAEEGDGKCGYINVFLYEDLKNAENDGEVKAIAALPVDSSASFCFVGQNTLYVGEFYREGSYETAKEHHFTTPAGDRHYAILTAYPLTADGALASDTPAYALSITDRVQGFAIAENGKIAVSRSWGMSNSSLDIYDGWTDNGDTITLSGGSVPLYYLDSATHEKAVTLPAFSEGLAMLNDETVLISFESACNKYVIGKLFFATNVVSYPLK